MNQNQSLDRLWELLLTPLPYLPKSSFLYRRTTPRRIQASKSRATTEGSSRKITVPTSTLSGTLERGRETAFAINGQDFTFDTNTWIFGELRLGALATVNVTSGEKALYAKKIVAV